jgi:fatty acid desaturase
MHQHRRRRQPRRNPRQLVLLAGVWGFLASDGYQRHGWAGVVFWPVWCAALITAVLAAAAPVERGEQ